MNKQHIVDEAMKLFLLQGVKSTTMDDIAKHLGISKRTIYENFKDKSDLLNEGINMMHGSEMEESENLRKQTDNVMEAMLLNIKRKREQFSRRKMRMLLDIKRYYPAVYAEHANRDAEIGLAKLSELFETGIRQGVFREDINPKTTAFLFSEQARLLFTEQAEKWEIETEKFDFSGVQVFEDLFMNFLRGIATPKGLEIIIKNNNK
ncbi:MAG: TetR/AcrR family transcriptional regulator [Prevotellaceae bacterium]|jgi:AcrR family transcriptional regulator|nr:TetR/AcrR family transcriptional regulator [Prevotellaceae bacterium]